MSKIDLLEGSAKEFAIACYNMNSVDELREGFNAEADAYDMKQWGIDVEEWKAAIEAALDDKLADAPEKMKII